jgi:hypothetical protein
MSVHLVPPEPEPVDLPAAAREAWQTADVKPSAAELAGRFGRSPRWARERIREARAVELAAVQLAAAVVEAEDAAAGAAEVAAADTPGAEVAADVAADALTDAGDPAPGDLCDCAGDGDWHPVGSGGCQLSEVAVAVAEAAEVAATPAARPAVPAVPGEVRAEAPPAAGGALWVASAATVLVVAGVALVTSFDHMRLLAAEHGERWRAWLLPVSVDGLMIAASLVILARRRRGLAAGWLPWVSLVGGVAASVAANVAQAEPNVVARLISAWAPVAALLGVELLMRQARDQREAPADA